MKKTDLEEYITRAKALSDPGRVRIVMALSRGELCVCQVIELLGLSPSTVSRHVAILRDAGFLETRKDGRWLHLSIPGRTAPAMVKRDLSRLKKAVGRSPEILEDRKRLKEILRIEKEELCRKRGRK